METTVDSSGGGHRMSSGFFLLSQWGQWTLRVHLQWKTRPQSSPGDLCLSNQSLRDQTWSRTWSGRGVQQDVVRGNKTLWETTHPARPHWSFKQRRLKPRPSRPLSLWFLQTEATVGFSFYTHTHMLPHTHIKVKTSAVIGRTETVHLDLRTITGIQCNFSCFSFLFSFFLTQQWLIVVS